jgi:hypothetical protein
VLITIPAEKKQIDMVKVAYSHLADKFSSNQISIEVVQKLTKFVECLSQKNYSGATAIQTVCTSN